MATPAAARRWNSGSNSNRHEDNGPPCSATSRCGLCRQSAPPYTIASIGPDPPGTSTRSASAHPGSPAGRWPIADDRADDPGDDPGDDSPSWTVPRVEGHEGAEKGTLTRSPVQLAGAEVMPG